MTQSLEEDLWALAFSNVGRNDNHERSNSDDVAQASYTICEIGPGGGESEEVTSPRPIKCVGEYSGEQEMSRKKLRGPKKWLPTAHRPDPHTAAMHNRLHSTQKRRQTTPRTHLQ